MAAALTLEKVREALIKQEDTIIFRLIERANFPFNSPTYDDEKFSSLSGSLLQFLVKETEAVQSKVRNSIITNYILFSYITYIYTPVCPFENANVKTLMLISAFAKSAFVIITITL